ncbi:flagellar filament capping protein FliD [Nesterenkonia halotolerans]|uniref:Flagellar hook-associated protein 2 n=1 Tax=Nesterenkonia halotolerans TaxID=225325 RepID=A0ABR9J652_9MICC|nr:flagellar filament capping protein FliD [Nesterenkonia halotolerans]MBE1514470.1 flagellar hook-associated protein 2 [Nesterenkonia halotolerans]
MPIALPGLASGLDSAALIESLMQVEAVPQQLLQRQATKTNTFVAALQGLNTRVAASAESSAEIAKPGALRAFTAQSSNDSVTAVTTSAAGAGSLDFTVESTAARHTLVTDAVSEWDTTEFSITAADGTSTAITADSTSLDDVVTAINASGAGVTAVKIPTGDGAHRLQLSAAATGAQGAFTLGDSATGSTITSAGADAAITLWAGTAAEQRVTSATNTFEGLMPGVDVTVSAVSAAPVTLSVARDAEAAVRTAESLVASVNSVLSYIRTNSKVSTGSDGSTAAGILTGDSAVRSAQQRMSDAVVRPVDGRSPSEIGISVTRDGALTFDQEKFSAALAADPAGVEATVAQLASRINGVAADLSDRYDGQITQRITGQEGLANRLTDQVEAWDDRLANRRATLERTYAALEVQMQSLNSQMDYLSSQLASLPQAASSRSNS